MIEEKPRVELHLFFASDNTKAVILYRAKNSLYRLIAWDTKDDKFELGQWLTSRVFERDCALSPDGNYFLYAAMQKRSSNLFMAISKPPYFTAIDYFPDMDPYSINGFFINNTTLSLRGAANGDAESVLPCGIRLDHSKKHWKHLRTASEWKKTPDEEVARIKAFTDDRRGQPAALAKCYRCDGAKLFRNTSGKEELLRDFSDMQFEAIRAPYRDVQRTATT